MLRILAVGTIYDMCAISSTHANLHCLKTIMYVVKG